MNCCKVGEIAEKRGLTVNADGGLHEYLVTRWVGDNGYPAIGVRKLADWFNQKLLRQAYTANGRNVTDIRITSEYEVLSGDDEFEKAEVLDDLTADGLDGEALVDDFVSRSTMRRHLTDCLEATKSDASETAASESDWELDQIQYGKERLERNVSEAIQSLDNKDRVPGGAEADIEVPVLLSCPECSTQVRLKTALDREFICREHLEAPVGETKEAVNSG